MASVTPHLTARRSRSAIWAPMFLLFFSVSLASSMSLADLYRCRQPDGTIELSDSGCGSGVVEQQYQYEPQPAPAPLPRSSSGNQYSTPNYEADAAARSLGFQSFTHFQSNLAHCVELYKARVTDRLSFDCGNDLNCLQRQGKIMSERTSALMKSSEWRSYKCDVAVQAAGANRKSSDAYEVEVSHNDEFFIINGEKFEAKTYCFDVEVGDEVVFADGGAHGACVSATIVNLRSKKTCELWCE